jgi:hypothetical protein
MRREKNEVNEDNERAKYKYLRALVERDGRCQDTAGKAADVILLFEKSTGFKPFKTFNDVQAVKFKEYLLNTISERTGRRLATATYVGTLGVLKSFFRFLTMDPDYRTKINFNDIGFFSATMKEGRIANADHEIIFPTLTEGINFSFIGSSLGCLRDFSGRQSSGPVVGDASGASALATAARSIASEADRENEACALEDRLDVEAAAELLEAGNPDGQNQHGNNRAECVHAPRPNGG